MATSPQPTSLGDLAVACYLFTALAGYDPSLGLFRAAVRGEVDLRDPAHQQALLVWLNHWGCRHLALKYHDVARAALGDWYEGIRHQLPPRQARLVSAGDVDLERVAMVFDGLRTRIVATRRRRGAEQEVTFGPTATAKALFALRPHLFIPWDEAMRGALGHDGTGSSYGNFLKDSRDALEKLEEECRSHGILLDDLPTRLGRPHSTAAQLVDEYHWIAITRGVALPRRRTLEEWLAWS